jgi:rhodanese-related sulfurtransferase
MVRRLLKSIRKRVHHREVETDLSKVKGRSDYVELQKFSTEKELISEEEVDFDLEVDAEELARWKKDGKEFQLIDIRESYELQNGFLDDSWNIPMNSIPEEQSLLPKDKALVIVCAAGIRSYQVTHYLRENGIEDVWSLDGGVAEWAYTGFTFPKKGKFSVGHRVTIAPNAIEPHQLKLGYLRVQNIIEKAGDLTYELAAWTDDGYRIFDGMVESEIDYYRV